MSESEQREIEKEAKAHALQNEATRYFELKPTLRNIALQCSNEGYIAGATAMAEKKNVEIKECKEIYNAAMDIATRKQAQLEAAQEEIKRWKEHWQYYEAELSRVKEVAEKMADGLEYIQWWVEASNKDNNINFDFERINTPLTEFANLMNKEK